MAEQPVKILDGNTFVVSDSAGDIEASSTEPRGLFAYDTRFLNIWRLTVDGNRLTPLSVNDTQYFETTFFLIPATVTVYSDSEVSVGRKRTIGAGFTEELTVVNAADTAADMTVRIEVGSDFADLFEVKDALTKIGTYDHRIEPNRLVLCYQRESFRRETSVETSSPGDVDEHGFTFKVHLEPGGVWSTRLDVQISAPSPYGDLVQVARSGRSKEGFADNLARWVDDAPKVDCDHQDLIRTYRRSLVDLAALRFSPAIAGAHSIPAAGLPWFMSMFGRDSIITSLQSLPFTPDLAATTIRVLGNWQGSRLDDFRDEDPGRIVHELRYGEMTVFEQRPQSPYYGTADATPLFVVLLDEYELWSGDADLVREFEHEARAALNWIDQYADLMGNGYISYRPRKEDTGLVNQCWKDSWNSISARDGRLPGFPRATCELQGYAYDAKLRGARLAREFWGDPGFADQLERQAADLKDRFNRDYWVDDGQYYALGMDCDGSLLDALSSNIGHLLWSGIVPPDRADAIVGHLMGPELYSGWGGTHPVHQGAPVQPHRVPRRHRLAVRQLLHRLGTTPVRIQARGRAARLRHVRRRQVLRRPPTRSVRRIPTSQHGIPRPVPDRVQPAGLVNRGATTVPARLARPAALRRTTRDRSRATEHHRTADTAGHPRTVGTRRRLRPRQAHRRHHTQSAGRRRTIGHSTLRSPSDH